MLRNPDESGRYPLNMREYEAIRMIFAAVTALDCDALRDRCDLTPGLWESLNKSKNEIFRVAEELLKSVPAKKLVSMQRELHYTVCEIKLKPPTKEAGRDFIYIPRKDFISLLQRAIQMDCLLCDKNIKEAKKCELYKNIDACFPYMLDEPTDTHCPFVGVSKLEVAPNDR